VPPAAPAPAPPAATPHAATALANADGVRQGVARLERAGRSIGLGAILRSDGRILTALSALGHGNDVRARFADDTTLPVRVVQTDRARDLALLAPEGGHWTSGLRPSPIEVPDTGRLHRFRARGGRLEAAEVAVSGHQPLLGRDGATLDDMLTFSTRLGDDELGSPLFDDRGEVAAIVVQACAPTAQTCQLSTFGAPVSALKQFLRKSPPREPLPAAHLGFRGVAAHDGSVAGVRVLTVEANGPAARAGLRGEPSARDSRANETGADLIVAVEDAPVTTPEEMRDTINRVALAPTKGGDASAERRVRLLVFGSGKFREVVLPLRPPRQLPEPTPPPPAKNDPGAGLGTKPGEGARPPAKSPEKPATNAAGGAAPAPSRAASAPAADAAKTPQ
jgi:S1-C subfamily serine protease